jgi:transcriptional regulator with XRE-family HTH domain
MKKPTPLKLARLTRGLTQEQLAKALGVEQSTVSYWEQDIGRMNFRDVLRVCKLLGINDINILKTEVSA